MNFKRKLWWVQHKNEVYKYSTFILLFIIVTISIIYFTYSKFTSKNEMTMYETTVEPFIKNDYFIASYINGEWSNEIPGKNDGYVVDKIVCDNGAVGTWNNEEWGINIRNATQKIKCSVFFKQATMVEQITTISLTDTTSFAIDDPNNNIRYIGANPNNYVYFNCSDYSNQSDSTCEKWRIIGVFKNVTKSDGTKEDLVKIIRNDVIENVAWDDGTATTEAQNMRKSKLNASILSLQQSSLNSYKVEFMAPDLGASGANDWSNASLKSILNGTYYNGTYATGAFKNDSTRNAIESVIWNLGSSSTADDVTASMFYERERGTTVYSGRPTTWTGKIGLMYPSDYGYATAGGSTTNRSICLTTSMSSWNESGVTDCMNNDYLYKSSYGTQWTLTSPSFYSDSAFFVYASGHVTSFKVGGFASARPAAFLKSNISITDVGKGTAESPYQLSVQ